MTNLSPAAQAVLDAFLADWQDESMQQYRACLAAALEALADQVVPANGSHKNNEIRAEILAIAAGLKQ